MRVSPGHSPRRPPLKKYVTCAYFSVSATWSWRAPCGGEHLGERVVRPPARRTRPGSRGPRGSASSSSGRSRARAAAARAAAPRSGRKLKKIAVSPGSSRGRPSKWTGSTNSSVTPASYCLHVREHGLSAVSPVPRDDRLEGASASAPSAGRGPSRSSGRDARDPVLRQLGEVVDGRVRRDVAPSVNAWIQVFSGREASSARRWSMCEWTPP